MRDRRLLGKETIEFIDGKKEEYSIHAVSNFEMMRLKRQFRRTKLDKKGNIESVDFEDENFVIHVLKLSIGQYITTEDLQCAETDLKEIYDKYFGKLTAEKKPKSTDMSEPNKDNESQA